MVKAITVNEEHSAFNRYRRIVNLKWQVERSFLEIGAELYEFQRLKEWRDLDYSSFNAFLADPEVNIARRTAHRMIRVWKEYVLRLEVQAEKLIAVGGTKLDMIASHVDENNVDKWLNTAVTLSKSDLRAEIDGKEPVFKLVAWRDLLHEARNACELLARTEQAPQEVREFAMDFWSNTEHHSP